MADDDDVDTMWAMADLVTAMAVRVAATLRIADHIVEGRGTAGDLAVAAGVDAGALDRVLRHLAAGGVLTRDESGWYGLTALGKILRDDHPSRIRALLDADTAIGRADLALVQLMHSVRTGEPAFELQFGRAFWDDVSADPARTASFDAQMGTDAAEWAQAVVPVYDWGSLGRVMDVGGGDGTLLIALLRAYPQLRGTVLEQPETADAARRAVAAAGLADRGDAVAGDFFGPLPAGAGGYVLMAIIHDWDDEAARSILRGCADAAGRQGRVFIVEKTGADGESPHTAMDLRLLVWMGGRERGVAELTTLAAAAGLRFVAVHQAGTISVIELTVL